MVTIMGIAAGTFALRVAGVGILAGAGTYAATESVRRSRKKNNTLQAVLAATGLCDKNRDGRPIPWRVVSSTRTYRGMQLTLRYPLGKSYRDVVKVADALQAGFGVPVLLSDQGSCLVIQIPDGALPTYVPLDDTLLRTTQRTFRVPVGLSQTGYVFHDFDRSPHLLVAGMTRAGKSAFLRTLISTLVLSWPEDVFDLYGFDLKPGSLEFSIFPGVFTSLLSHDSDFMALLVSSWNEMEERAKLLSSAGVTQLHEYEAMTGRTFRRVFLVIDEFAQLLGLQDEARIRAMLQKIIAVGAGLGVHVVLCTQRPDHEVVDGKIRANLTSTLVFRVSTGVQSRVVLGHDGAEALPRIDGRGIYADGGETVVQAPYISVQEARRRLLAHGRKRGISTKVLPESLTLSVPVVRLPQKR